jgi:hypothetical protein
MSFALIESAAFNAFSRNGIAFYSSRSAISRSVAISAAFSSQAFLIPSTSFYFFNALFFSTSKFFSSLSHFSSASMIFLFSSSRISCSFLMSSSASASFSRPSLTRPS